jgi:hypothetical protein
VLWHGDRRDRVELEEPEPADGIEDAARGAVQELRPDGNPARLLDSDLPRRPGLRHNPSSKANVRSLRISGSARV